MKFITSGINYDILNIERYQTAFQYFPIKDRDLPQCYTDEFLGYVPPKNDDDGFNDDREVDLDRAKFHELNDWKQKDMVFLALNIDLNKRRTKRKGDVTAVADFKAYMEDMYREV